MAVNERRITSNNLREIVKGLAAMPDENRRFERLAATKETFSLVYGNPDIYEQVLEMLTGNNRFIFEAGFEPSINKRYRLVKEKICDLNTLQFAVTVNILPPIKYFLLLKERCNRCNDNAACISLDERINGEPDADDEISRLGLIGLWELQDNRHAGGMLVELEVITEDDFKRISDERDGKAAAPPAEPKIEDKSLQDLEAMKKEIEARMKELKTTPPATEEPAQLKETLELKEEVMIPPSNLSLEYMGPTDYERWRFWDFEGIIPGLDFEDLQELYEYVSLPEKMTDQERETIREMIKKRINEIRAEGL